LGWLILDSGEDGSGILVYSVDIELAETRAARITWVVFRRIKLPLHLGFFDKCRNGVRRLFENSAEPKESCQVSNHMVDFTAKNS
jgi:hypothetical protein